MNHAFTLTNFASLALYIGGFFVACCCGHLYQKTKNKMSAALAIILLWAILTFISGFRTYVGGDYGEYVSAFNGNWYSQVYDPLSRLLFDLAKTIWGHSQMVFFLFAALSNFFLVLILTRLKKKNVKLSFMLLLGVYIFIFFPLSLNIMRQGLASVILIYATILLLDGKILHALFIFCLAVMAHKSAIFLLPFAIIYKISSPAYLRRNVIIIVGIIAGIFMTGIIKMLPGISGYGNYLESFSLSGIDWLVFISYIPLLALLSVLPADKDDEKETFLRILFVTGILLEVVLSSTFASRIGIYLSMVSIIILPHLLCKVRSARRRLSLSVLLFIFSIVYFIVVFYFHGRACIFPYSFSI